jgi:hypothetical protein
MDLVITRRNTGIIAYTLKIENYGTLVKTSPIIRPWWLILETPLMNLTLTTMLNWCGLKKQTT